MQASGLTEFNSFICSSVIWGQPCFPVHLKEQQMAASCFSQLLSNHHGGWQHPLDALGALIHNWRPEITDGCDISCLLIWQEVFSFHRLSPALLHCRQIPHYLSHQGSPVFFYTFYLFVFFFLPDTHAILLPCIYDQNQHRGK